jgi:signal transduction histidine kinase
MIQRSPPVNRVAPRPTVRARSAAAATPAAVGASAELRAVLEAMPDAVLVCDPADQVRMVNPAAARMFAGRPVHNRADLLARFETPPDEPAADQPLTLRPRDMTNRWFELRSVPIRRPTEPSDDAAAGRILILRDVTEGRLARAERKAFLAILSHELRTPITTIYAGSRVLARRAAASQSAAASQLAGGEIAADISAEAAHLYDVVEDLLVLTRAEQGLLDLSVEPVLLQRLVESTIRIAARRTPIVPIERAGTTDPPAVRGDAVYIEQAIRNLVTAASRFGGPDVPVVVRLAADDREVSLSVLDRGPDVRRNEAERLLDLVEEPRGLRQSVGIGPFVCRRIVEAMGGRIWASPRDDGGLEIGFALPRYDDRADADFDEGLSA